MNEHIAKFRNYLTNKSLCALTIRSYIFDVVQFMEWLEDRGISLDLVTAEIATQYLDYLVTSRHEIRPGKIGVYSPRTIMKKIAVVRSFFYFLGEGNE